VKKAGYSIDNSKQLSLKTATLLGTLWHTRYIAIVLISRNVATTSRYFAEKELESAAASFEVVSIEVVPN
jgi:hypothetical protein